MQNLCSLIIHIIFRGYFNKCLHSSSSAVCGDKNNEWKNSTLWWDKRERKINSFFCAWCRIPWMIALLGIFFIYKTGTDFSCYTFNVIWLKMLQMPTRRRYSTLYMIYLQILFCFCPCVHVLFFWRALSWWLSTFFHAMQNIAGYHPHVLRLVQNTST